MRGVKVFSGSSHPMLASSVCERLGITQSKADLTKFSNGETSVSVGPSIRNHDVYIVQSGSPKMNDSVMELLIMASACKGGSAKSITAVVPYFPYSRQSKKKSHRGAITARMLANLCQVAGVTHVITVDLHASPMQGFFACPVDNLRAEPLIARWIRNHVPDWQEAVVVSKNAGGSKRVTSMADALKLNFGIITTDRRRQGNGDSGLEASTIYNGFETSVNGGLPENASRSNSNPGSDDSSGIQKDEPRRAESQTRAAHLGAAQALLPEGITSPRRGQAANASPRSQPTGGGGHGYDSPRNRSARSRTAALALRSVSDEEDGDQFTSERTGEVIHGRLIHGHIVDDDHPSPALSAVSSTVFNNYPGSPTTERQDPMTASFMSTASSLHADAMGGGGDGNVSDDDEASLNNPEIEHTITLVGNVKDRTVFLVDDMIDSPQAWIAAAETVRKRGNAGKVYCIATHGLFGDDSLEQLENCDCIDYIVVCNTFPINPDRIRNARKLVILDLSSLLSEAIRRNHYGESISQLYQFYQD